MPRMIRTTPTSVTGFTAFSSLSWLYFPDCWCRANRVLPCPESLADLLLRVLQEFVGPVQDIPAAVQHLPGRLLYRPDRLRSLCTHPARPVLHVRLHLPSPQPYDGCPHDRSQDKGPTGSHRSPPRWRFQPIPSQRLDTSSLDPHVVLDGLHPRDPACDLHRLVDVRLGPDEAAQLHHALERLDVDLVDLQAGIVEDRRLHLRRDHGVIDVLSGPLSRCRRTAPQGRRQQDAESKDPEPSQWSHSQTSIRMTIPVRITRTADSPRSTQQITTP